MDALRSRGVEGYTYWDYQQLRFPRNEGMRIDFILGSRAFDDLVTAAHIDREQRKGDARVITFPWLLTWTWPPRTTTIARCSSRA